MKVACRMWIVLPVAVLVLPLMAQERSDDKSSSRPTAVLVAPVYDFGEIEYDEEVVHEFEIRNDGDRTLELFDARSSCGCTVVDFDDRIEPGSSGRMRVKLNPRSLEGAFAVGVTVFTNDQANAQLNLTIKAELAQRVAVQPGYVRYAAARGSSNGRVVEQLLWGADGHEVAITSVESTVPFVDVTFAEATTDAEGARWLVRATLRDDAPAGPIRGVLVVTVDHPFQEVVRIPILGFVDDVFTATPKVLDFGLVDLGDGVESSLRLKRSSLEEIELISVETTVAGVEVEILPAAESDPARVRYVRIRLTPAMKRGSFEGVVRVRTASPDMPVVEVPLFGTVS